MSLMYREQAAPWEYIRLADMHKQPPVRCRCVGGGKLDDGWGHSDRLGKRRGRRWVAWSCLHTFLGVSTGENSAWGEELLTLMWDDCILCGFEDPEPMTMSLVLLSHGVSGLGKQVLHPTVIIRTKSHVRLLHLLVYARIHAEEWERSWLHLWMIITTSDHDHGPHVEVKMKHMYKASTARPLKEISRTMSANNTGRVRQNAAETRKCLSCWRQWHNATPAHGQKWNEMQTNMRAIQKAGPGQNLVLCGQHRWQS